jgi:hypothetical protein
MSMSSSDGPAEPDKRQARRTALMAHAVVAKLKVMGLPQELDAELASLSTDLGDLWSAQAELGERLEGFLKSASDWEAVGDGLVDMRVAIDHLQWHVRSVRRPMTRVTQYAYKQASET